ncbi:MCP four helix bundle domain-containing protein, partial [Cellulomonas citrea]|uniref:MCP four helix bundle domain-containing protein n=1 Tax=Cellulomonas citrea TaxID=1909423 RepID=UPI001359E057
MDRRRRGFRDLPIALKLGAVAGLFALFGAAMVALAVSRIGTISAQQDTMYSDSSVPMGKLVVAVREFGGYRGRVVALPMVPAAGLSDAVADVQAKQTKLTDAFDAYLPLVASADDRQTIQTQLTAFLDLSATVTSQVQAGDRASAEALVLGDLKTTATALNDALVAQTEILDSTASRLDKQGSELAASSAVLLLLALAVGVLVPAAITVVIVRSIRRTLLEIDVSVDAMASGDLTRTPDVDSRDELGRVAAKLGRAQGALRGVIGSVVTTAAAVAASAEELSAAGAQVASGSEETSAQAGVVAAAAE